MSGQFKDRIVPVMYLRACALWNGSNEQFEFNHGGLMLSSVIYKYNQMLDYDDFTMNEIFYRDALMMTIESFAPEQEF